MTLKKIRVENKMTFILNRGLSSEKLEDTTNNVVIKFDTQSVKRMHSLSLEEAKNEYVKILKNLTKSSS
jgi:hypothetical protein